MARRTMLEQEFYERFRDQGMDEYSASDMAKEWAVDQGEYDDLIPDDSGSGRIET